MTKAIGAVTIGILIGIAIFVFSGTVLWVIYPHIHALFPNAAANGIIAKELDWWDAVCVTWIAGILWGKSASTSNKNSKD